LVSVKNRSHRGPFCLGSMEPEAIEPSLLASVFVPPEAIWAFFFKFDNLWPRFSLHPRPYVLFFYKFDTLDVVNSGTRLLHPLYDPHKLILRCCANTATCYQLFNSCIEPNYKNQNLLKHRVTYCIRIQ